MKEHLKLLALVPEIDAILAVRSLFGFEGDFQGFDDSGLSTLESENNRGTRMMFVQGIEDPVIEAQTDDEKIIFKVASLQAVPEPVRHLLAGMGLSFAAGKQGGQAGTSGDAETLFDRILTLDAAWLLLRRIKQFDTDPDRVQSRANGMLQFASLWQKNRTQALNKGESTSLLAQTKRLEDSAGEFLQMELGGIEKITLHYDPRGTAYEVKWKDITHATNVVPLTMDWPLGRVQVSGSDVAQAKVARTPKFSVTPTKLSDEVVGVLSSVIVVDRKVKIVQRLTPKLFATVNSLFVEMGGRWKTADQAHVFDEDPTSRIDDMVATAKVFTEKDFEFYPTPPNLIERMIRRAQIELGMKVLEPSAGVGGIAMAAAEVVGKENVTCFELMPKHVKTLDALGLNVREPRDFLAIKPEPIWDRVVMNPPFSGGRDIAHIQHAMHFLKPGGILVAIASTSWQTSDNRAPAAFRDFLNALDAAVDQIEAGTFKSAGTPVPTTLIVICKPKEAPKSKVELTADMEQSAQAALF